MIFWMGFEKRPNFLVQTLYAENISYKLRGKYKKDFCQGGFSQKMRQYGGSHFLERVSFEYGDRIVVFKRIERKTPLWRKEFEMKIYTEQDKVSEMPQKVLVKTNNLDFIRELFDLGKEVSWYDPDLNFFSAHIAMFKFEHLFLDLFNTEKVIFPTGKAFDNMDEYGKRFINSKNPIRPVKFRSKIGYWPYILGERAYRMDYIRLDVRKGKKLKFDRWCLYPEAFRVYYNMLSITYMLWSKSIVVNAQKKVAPHV